MIERICPKCRVPMNGDKCIKPNCGCATKMSSTIYWCDDCNVPIFENICPSCGNKGRYIATDMRPVFPEENVLISLILGDNPQKYQESSVWFGSGMYIIDGKKVRLSITKLNSLPLDKIHKLKEKYEAFVTKINYCFFDEYIRKFIKANADRYNFITEEAVQFVQKYREKYAIEDMMVSFSGGKDSTVTSHIVNRALGTNKVLHIFGDTTLEFPYTLEYKKRFKKNEESRGVRVLTAKNREKNFEDLCDIVGPPSRVMRWCCTVFKTGAIAHKSIKEYGKYLSRDLINLFTGIEGRIIEKYFVTSSKNNYELIKNAIVKDDSKLLNIPHYEKYLGKEKFKEFYSLPAFRSGFDETEFKNVIFNGCYPLNPIAAYLLLNISEKVAQNERTLFTFISNDEPHSMARFVSEHTLDKEWSIGADLIYEYFSALFKKDVVNEFIHNIWLSAEYAIDKCDTEDQRKIVKALAVILIVNKEDEIPATEKYLKLCINASDPEQALMELKKKEFIYKKNSTDSYVFKTRAGSELKAEIKRQRELKGENVNYSKVLLDVTGNYFIIPRKYNTVKMMTRYFTNEFMSVDDFLNITSSTALLDNTLDGKVITLYSFSRIKQEAVKQHLLELAEKRLVVICPKKGLKAKIYSL